MDQTTEHIVRLANLQDLPSILDIYNYAVLHTNAVYREEPTDLQERQSWFESKQLLNQPILVVELDQKVVAFASYGAFRNWPGFRYTAEHSVYVHPDFEGRGFAQKILLELMKLATKNNIKILVAGIDAHNAASIHLHKKLGFTQTGFLPKVGFKFNTWLDLIFMQKEI
jgi:L-amino acid N-acyltransferase